MKQVEREWQPLDKLENALLYEYYSRVNKHKYEYKLCVCMVVTSVIAVFACACMFTRRDIGAIAMAIAFLPAYWVGLNASRFTKSESSIRHGFVKVTYCKIDSIVSVNPKRTMYICKLDDETVHEVPSRKELTEGMQLLMYKFLKNEEVIVVSEEELKRVCNARYIRKVENNDAIQ